MTDKCNICNSKIEPIFSAKVLNKYNANYYRCSQCGYISIKEPFWIEEAYNNPMNNEDTGILERNILMSELATVILYSSFNIKGIFLDYAGGYGVFVRLMRDIGFDFHWIDPYTENIFALGFEYALSQHSPIELITAFEVFEHFVNPINEIENILKISRNVLFSTLLVPDPPPPVSEWWYYGLEHGQHISFYSVEACQAIAKRYGLQFYSFESCHLFTDKLINERFVKFLIKRRKILVLRYIHSNMQSKTFRDSSFVKSMRKR